jgi:hypothetical protein
VRLEEDPLVVLRREVRRGVLEAREVVVPEVGVDRQQHLDVRVAQDPPELPRLAVGVQQHHDRTDARAREPPDDPVGAVRGEEPDARALADPRGEQAACEARGALVGGGVRQALVAEDGEVLVAVLGRAGADQLAGGGREGREARLSHGHQLPPGPCRARSRT